jgi:hypothetical protein
MPYHRIESPTQTVADAARQEATGEVWGRSPRWGFKPKVKAFVGSLPRGARGVEFETDVAPDRGCPPGLALWSGPRAGVAVEDDYARIKVRVTRNTQRP